MPTIKPSRPPINRVDYYTFDLGTLRKRANDRKHSAAPLDTLLGDADWALEIAEDLHRICVERDATIHALQDKIASPPVVEVERSSPPEPADSRHAPLLIAALNDLTSAVERAFSSDVAWEDVADLEWSLLDMAVQARNLLDAPSIRDRIRR